MSIIVRCRCSVLGIFREQWSQLLDMERATSQSWRVDVGKLPLHVEEWYSTTLAAASSVAAVSAIPPCAKATGREKVGSILDVCGRDGAELVVSDSL